jgi:NDP-sugar pyrophosphorylase family protein
MITSNKVDVTPYIALKNIDVLILAGGLGTRLRSVVKDRPKTMAEVNGVPFLDILLESLSKHGVERFILCTGYMGDYIKNYYSDKSNDYVIVFSNEKYPLGTGGAIKNAEKLIISDPFVILNGDSFCEMNYNDFLQYHCKKNALITIAVSKSGDNGDYGKIVLDGKNRIIEFSEKAKFQKEAYVNAGIYCMTKLALRFMPANGFFSVEKDFFPSVLSNHIYAYIVEQSFIDIGTPERFYAIMNKKRND